MKFASIIVDFYLDWYPVPAAVAAIKASVDAENGWFVSELVVLLSMHLWGKEDKRKEQGQPCYKEAFCDTYMPIAVFSNGSR